MISRSLQELFVDRLLQLERFRKSLDGASDRRIILIEAPSGMGKSWLLQQYAYEANERNATAVLIDFSDGQAYDVITLARRFRDAFGSAHFNHLTNVINDATAPRLVLGEVGTSEASAISFGANSQAGDITTGDVAGGSIIKDNLFVVQTDNPLLLQAIEDRITQALFTCLIELTQRTRLLFCFDSYERTAQSGEAWIATAADRWITTQLLTRIRDGILPNSVAVLAGSRLPPFSAQWSQVIGRMELHLFTLEDVTEYLRENRGLPSLTDTEIQTLYNAVQGNPQLLGIIGDNLEQSTGPVRDDDW